MPHHRPEEGLSVRGPDPRAHEGFRGGPLRPGEKHGLESARRHADLQAARGDRVRGPAEGRHAVVEMTMPLSIQHYDENISAVFFRELAISKQDHHLEVGSGSNAEQTARIMIAIEKIFRRVGPTMSLLSMMPIPRTHAHSHQMRWA